MTQPIDRMMDFLQNLGTPSQLRQRSASRATTAAPCANSHIHLPPNFSAFRNVAQAVELAEAQQLAALGVSNYYDFTVYAEFSAAARKAAIFPLFGLEIIALIDKWVKSGVKINDPGNPGKMYLCGKGITRFANPTEQARKLIDLIRSNDSRRMAAMTEKLNGVLTSHGLEIALSPESIIRRLAERYGCPPETIFLQERHLAQAFGDAIAELDVQKQSQLLSAIAGKTISAASLKPADLQNQVRSHLMKAGKPAFVEETFVDLAQARTLVLELGGIPCYPVLADGASPICAYEQPVSALIDNIRSDGFGMAELIPIRNKPEVLVEYATALRRAGLVVLGGTEHNTPDLLPMQPTCLGGAAVPEPIKELFWEGVCVVAAHQFLVLHGECGFVDSRGQKNPAYTSDEARIADFRSLGETVIEQYRNSVSAGEPN